MKKPTRDQLALLVYLILIFAGILFVTATTHAQTPKPNHIHRHHRLHAGATPTPVAVQGSFYGTTANNHLSASFSGIAGSPAPSQQAVTGTFYGSIVNGRISGQIIGNVTNPTLTPTPSATPTPVAGLPDLIVVPGSVTISPASPAAGDRVIFNVTVKNQGKAATPPNTIIGVSFMVDGQQAMFSDTDMTPLAPDASITLTANGGPTGLNYWAATAGTHKVSAMVDDINRIAESDETNNTFNAPALNVGAAPIPSATPVANNRKVFAHYMLAYDNTVDGYKKEIQEAQSIGVDGFALNYGAYSAEPRYVTDMANMYAAANQLNSGFKLFLSPDECCGMPAADVVTSAAKYCSDPAQFLYSGKCVLSSWQASGLGNAATWKSSVLDKIGNPIFFVPHTGGVAEVPTQSAVASLESAWNSIADGYFYFGVAGIPTSTDSPSLIAGMKAWAAATHASGKLYMSPAATHYDQPGRRYFEYYGGQGIENQWNEIINVDKPEWIELTTWNDYSESWITPTGGSTPQCGAEKLTGYFIEWYKTGIQPPITNDNVYLFYRISPARSGGSGTLNGNVTDTIYVTVLAKAAASLSLTQAGNAQSFPIKAGINQVSMPSTVGSAPAYSLIRDGVIVLSGSGGNPITASPIDWNPSTACASTHSAASRRLGDSVTDMNRPMGELPPPPEPDAPDPNAT